MTAATVIAWTVLGLGFTCVCLIITAIVIDRRHTAPVPGAWKAGEQTRRAWYRTPEQDREVARLQYPWGSLPDDVRIVWSGLLDCAHEPRPDGATLICLKCGAVGQRWPVRA